MASVAAVGAPLGGTGLPARPGSPGLPGLPGGPATAVGLDLLDSQGGLGSLGRSNPSPSLRASWGSSESIAMWGWSSPVPSTTVHATVHAAAIATTNIAVAPDTAYNRPRRVLSNLRRSGGLGVGDSRLSSQFQGSPGASRSDASALKCSRRTRSMSSLGMSFLPMSVSLPYPGLLQFFPQPPKRPVQARLDRSFSHSDRPGHLWHGQLSEVPEHHHLLLLRGEMGQRLPDDRAVLEGVRLVRHGWTASGILAGPWGLSASSARP